MYAWCSQCNDIYVLLYYRLTLLWRFVAPFGELHLNKPLTADELRKACGYTHQMLNNKSPRLNTVEFYKDFLPLLYQHGK